MKHKQQIFATDCCENCLSYILYCALASRHIAITVTNGLCSLQQIHPLIGNKDADPVDVLVKGYIHIKIDVEVSVFLIIHLKRQLTY
jgi:hypothetical protein